MGSYPVTGISPETSIHQFHSFSTICDHQLTLLLSFWRGVNPFSNGDTLNLGLLLFVLLRFSPCWLVDNPSSSLLGLPLGSFSSLLCYLVSTRPVTRAKYTPPFFEVLPSPSPSAPSAGADAGLSSPALGAGVAGFACSAGTDACSTFSLDILLNLVSVKYRFGKAL